MAKYKLTKKTDANGTLQDILIDYETGIDNKPTNLVTTDTNQVISGDKTFNTRPIVDDEIGTVNGVFLGENDYRLEVTNSLNVTCNIPSYDGWSNLSYVQGVGYRSTALSVDGDDLKELRYNSQNDCYDYYMHDMFLSSLTRETSQDKEVALMGDIPTIPTVNNSTITLQKNGVTIGDFTLNQSSSETIDIGNYIGGETTATATDLQSLKLGYYIWKSGTYIKFTYGNNQSKIFENPLSSLGDIPIIIISIGSSIVIASPTNFDTEYPATIGYSYFLSWLLNRTNGEITKIQFQTGKLNGTSLIGNWYAPTSAGTSGQFLKSTGGAPTWETVTIPDVSGKEDTSNKVTSISSSSTDTQYPSAKCVFDEIGDVTEIAEGKTKNYVIDDTTTGTNVVNTSFNSTNDTITITITSNKIKDVLNNTINLSDLKVGDIVSVTQTSVPDRWVGSITSSEITFYKLETKFDIDASPTSSSTNPVSSGGVYTALGDYVTKATAQTVSGAKTFSASPVLNNAILLRGKDSNGTLKNLIGITASNNIVINNENAGNTLVGGTALAPISANNNAMDLGVSSTNQWNNIYGKKLYQNGVQVTTSSESAVSGGTTKSLVTTGEKYTWNNKQDAITNPLTYSDTGTYNVAGTNKTTYTYAQTAIYAPNGLIMGGTAAAAGLVTRGICGVGTPSTGGACSKDNLYLNYDSDNTYRSNRQVILQAGATGTHYGNNLYQYAAARGDAVKGYCDATYVTQTTAQTVSGVKTFSNGLKIGDATLSYDSTNKCLKVTF